MKWLNSFLILIFALTSSVGWAGNNNLLSVADTNNNEFLDPDIAFQVTAKRGGGNNIITHWVIADGYYLYKDKISISQKDNTQITLGVMGLPQGEKMEDEYFGKIVSIDHNFQSIIPIQNITAETNVINLIVKYQGCAKAGLCYPPVIKDLSVAWNSFNHTDSDSIGTINTTTDALVSNANFQSEQDRIASALASGKLWLTIISFFGLGLLLAFTPCIFPMIPILSSIIVGQGKEVSTSRAFTLSLVYVLAMAVAYTLAGVIVGMSGENVQIWFQNPWVISAFAGIFVLLSLAMFGVYELQMPNAVQLKLNMISANQKQGSYVGAGIMGLLSALIVGPCVTPPLIGVLIYIAETGNELIGGIALFTLSIGMGTPLLVIGTSAGKVLPKAGPWMDTVKAVFGVMLIGLAIWMLDRILPASVILLLVGALLIFSAIYMGALRPIKETAAGWPRLWKGLGLISLIYGGILVVGAAGGSHSLLQPLQGITLLHMTTGSSNTSPTPHKLSFQQIKGVEGLNTALQQAAKDGRPVMLDFYADWCISCKEMESFTFSDAGVESSLKSFVVLQSDVTSNDMQDKALLKSLGLPGPPAILFYGSSGNELRNYRIVGFMGASKFISHIENFKQSGAVTLSNL